jgi:hypothetical protein
VNRTDAARTGTRRNPRVEPGGAISRADRHKAPGPAVRRPSGPRDGGPLVARQGGSPRRQVGEPGRWAGGVSNTASR